MLDVSEPRFGQGTPTASALEAAGQALSERPTPSDFIVLATDGGPGCNQRLDPQACTCLNASCVLFDMAENCLDDARTIETVRRLREDSGIQTFVLGLTSEDFLAEARQVLDDMAVAGHRPEWASLRGGFNRGSPEAADRDGRQCRPMSVCSGRCR